MLHLWIDFFIQIDPRPGKEVWECGKRTGISLSLVKVIQSIYKDEEYHNKLELRLNRDISPTLFKIYLHHVERDGPCERKRMIMLIFFSRIALIIRVC